MEQRHLIAYLIVAVVVGALTVVALVHRRRKKKPRPKNRNPARITIVK